MSAGKAMDIVDRLKRVADQKSNLDRDKDLLMAAIAEIEQLRAALRPR